MRPSTPWHVIYGNPTAPAAPHSAPGESTGEVLTGHSPLAPRSVHVDSFDMVAAACPDHPGSCPIGRVAQPPTVRAASRALSAFPATRSAKDAKTEERGLLRDECYPGPGSVKVRRLPPGASGPLPGNHDTTTRDREASFHQRLQASGAKDSRKRPTWKRQKALPRPVARISPR